MNDEGDDTAKAIEQRTYANGEGFCRWNKRKMKTINRRVRKKIPEERKRKNGNWRGRVV